MVIAWRILKLLRRYAITSIEATQWLELLGRELAQLDKLRNLREGMSGGLPIDKTYIVRFKSPELSSDVVAAARVELRGEVLAFVNSKGELVAGFLFEFFESWSELPSADI